MNAADGLRKPQPDTFVESMEGGVAMSEKQWSAGTVLGAVALLIVTGCDDGIGPAGSANLAVEDQIQLPDGFHISLWADNIVRPR